MKILFSLITVIILLTSVTGCKEVEIETLQEKEARFIQWHRDNLNSMSGSNDYVLAKIDLAESKSISEIEADLLPFQNQVRVETIVFYADTLAMGNGIPSNISAVELAGMTNGERMRLIVDDQLEWLTSTFEGDEQLPQEYYDALSNYTVQVFSIKGIAKPDALISIWNTVPYVRYVHVYPDNEFLTPGAFEPTEALVE